MEHRKTTVLEAKATATDQGAFTAIAAAYTVDRVKDRIIPGAFATTIKAWQASGKMIPLHWNHLGDASNIIGHVNPASMAETSEGLYVEGKLDLEGSVTAKEAWRSMKSNSMSLSFGYGITKARKAAGGIQELQELDLFEISIVPVPANADTRIISVKSNAHDAVCETCGQHLAGRKSDSGPSQTGFSDAISGTLVPPGTTGTPDVKQDQQEQHKDDGYWDDLRRESYRLAASVLLDG